MSHHKQILNNQQLKEMHGGEYITIYENTPINRLTRLRKYFDLPQESIVVDFACGNAMLLEVLHGRIKEYHGVDFSSEMIASAKLKSENNLSTKTYFYEEDIHSFSNRHTGSFDAAFAMDFSEHVFDKEWVEILIAIKNTLKPQGVLYLHTPNGNYFIEILKQKGIFSQIPQHIAVRNDIYNAKLLKDAGFNDVKIKYLPHYEWRQKPFWILAAIPFIGKYFKARLFITAKQSLEK